jgi:hypothetical protein
MKPDTTYVASGFSRAYALNETPHPQVLFAFGLFRRNPLLSRLVS